MKNLKQIGIIFTVIVIIILLVASPYYLKKETPKSYTFNLHFISLYNNTSVNYYIDNQSTAGSIDLPKDNSGGHDYYSIKLNLTGDNHIIYVENEATGYTESYEFDIDDIFVHLEIYVYDDDYSFDLSTIWMVN